MAGLSLHFMSFHPKYCTLAYVISCLLDAVDGQAARALGQTSKFGAVLDMVTDRYVVDFVVAVSIVPDFDLKMYNIMSVMLPLICVSRLRNSVSIPDRTRLFKPLHAHV